MSIEHVWFFWALKWCHEQSCSFRQIPKYVNANRSQHVRSSSCLITVVVMTLYQYASSAETNYATNCSEWITPMCDFWLHEVSVRSNSLFNSRDPANKVLQDKFQTCFKGWIFVAAALEQSRSTPWGVDFGALDSWAVTTLRLSVKLLCSKDIHCY